MALPKLNSTPKYKMTVPSTGQEVDFRPFLVKEEKVLMMAMETGDDESGIRAIVDTISSCVATEIDTNTLKSYDIEYLFLRIRAKSVGEKSTITIACKECEHPNPYVINLESLEVSEGESAKDIPLTPELTVSMKFPSYKDLLTGGLRAEGEHDLDVIFNLIGKCIDGVKTEDEYFSMVDQPQEEIKEFIESLSSEQFGKIRDFVESMPKLSHNAELTCEECGAENKQTLSGIQSFFS